MLLPEFFSGQNKFQRAVVGLWPFIEGIIQSSDHGYIMIGTYNDSQDADIFVTKFDVTGSLEWSKSIGRAGQQQGFSITEASDGGYVGIAGSYGQHFQAIFKIDIDGNFIWEKSINRYELLDLKKIITTNDGGYAVVGRIFGPPPQIYVAKFNSSFTFQWQKVINGGGNAFIESIIQTTDGGFAISATSLNGNGGEDFYVIRLNQAGNLIWMKTIGGAGDDEAYDLVQTNDGGFVCVGGTKSFGAGSEDVYIVKVDLNGDLLWTKTIGGDGDDYGTSVIQTIDGGMVLAGVTSSYPIGLYQMYLLKLNATGLLLWTKIFDSGGDAEGNYIVNCSDGGFAIGGDYTTNNQRGMLLMKFDNSENTCGTFTTGGVISSGGTTGSVGTIENESGYIDSGLGLLATSNGSMINICNSTGIDSQVFQNIVLTIESNPFLQNFIINVSIQNSSSNNILALFDLHGKKIFEKRIGNLSNGVHSYEINCNNIPSGMYICSLQSSEGIYKKKIVKE